MIEKIKAWVETIKDLLWYIIGPLAVIGAIAWELFSRPSHEKLEKKEAEIKAADAEVNRKIGESDAAEEEYKRVRDAYLSNGAGSDGGGEGKT